VLSQQAIVFICTLRKANKASIGSETERQTEEQDIGDLVRDTTLGEGGPETIIASFEGSQPVPARPSGKGDAYDRNCFIFLYDVGRAAL
jgi:hypothetical protein